jgi:hypothetical protein
MSMKYDVPFVSNTPDDLRCVPASYLTILKYFKPDTAMTMSRWSKLTGYEAGKGTWASKALLWFAAHGFDVKHFEQFDYEDFIKSGGDYLIRLAGPEVGQWQIDHSNIPLEQKRAQKLLAGGLIEYREPTINDIKHYLDEGYLVKLLINSRRLNNKPGYVGHSVTAVGYTDDSIIIHDPGLPPIPNRTVKFEDFEAAWAYPNVEAKELDAIRLKA